MYSVKLFNPVTKNMLRCGLYDLMSDAIDRANYELRNASQDWPLYTVITNRKGSVVWDSRQQQTTKDQP